MASVFLIPEVNQRWFNNTGGPLSGGKLFFYAAGTTSLTNTYTDATGTVPNSNPVVLDSGGMPPNMIWGVAGQKYKCVIQDSLGNPVGITMDNLQNIDDVTVAGSVVSEWVGGPTPTFVNATSFSVSGDQRGTFTLGRRVQASVTAGTVYGTITAATFAGGITTVTVAMDGSTALDSGLSAVSYGLVSYQNTSGPNYTAGGTGTIASAATLNLDGTYAAVITGTTAITAVQLGQGKQRTLIAQSAGLTITPGGSLITPTGRNIVTAANDRLTFLAVNGNVYVSITRSLNPTFTVQSGTSAGIGTVSTKVPFNSIVGSVNDGTCFDAVTNNRFTPTVPGYYLISMTINGNNGSTTLSVSAMIMKNGSQFAPAAFFELATTNNISGSVSQSVIVPMNGTTDFIEGFVFTNTGTFTLQISTMTGTKVDV